MQRKWSRRWLCAVALLGVAATTLVSVPASAASKSGSGGSVTMLHTVEPVNFDPNSSHGPFNATGNGVDFAAVYGTLLYEDSGANKLAYQIAKSLTSADGIVWTLKLRPDVKFSDGTLLDAAAVQYNWQRMADPANAAIYASSAQTIHAMEVVDPTTLKITLKTPNEQFPRLVARQMPFIGSPTAMKADLAKFRSQPVGAGPFVVKEFVRGSYIKFARNPNYYDKPRPYIDELVISLASDAEQRYNTFLTGAAQLNRIYSAWPQVSRARQDGIKLSRVNTRGNYYFILNTARPPFNDVTARHALQYALNQKLHAETLAPGGGTERVATLFSKNSPFYEADLKLPQFNAKKAQQLIDEYQAKNGQPLKFTFLSGANTAESVKFFQSQLAQFKNLEVSVEEQAASALSARRAAGTFDVFTAVHSGADPYPEFEPFLMTGGSQNGGKYSNPLMDAALMEGRSAQLNQRKQAYRKVQQLLIDDAPLVFYATNDQWQMVVDNMRGLAYAGDGVPLFDNVRMTGTK